MRRSPNILRKAQYTPFAPAEIAEEHNFRPFEPADLSMYGNGPQANEGFFFTYERLVWAFTGPKDSPIGDEASAGVINNAAGFNFLNLNSFDNSFINTQTVWGNRFEGGYVEDDRGWLVSTAHVHTQHSQRTLGATNIAFADPLGLNLQFVDFNNDGIDDDLNLNGIFGNTSPFNFDALPFPISDGVLDTYVGPDFGDQISLPINFSNVFVFNQTKLSTIELMRVNRWEPLHYGGTIEFIYGARYMNVADKFGIFGFNGQGVITQLAIQNAIDNRMIGGQVGLRYNRQTGRWRVGAEARFTAAANFQNTRLEGNYIGSGGQLQAGLLNAYNDAQTDTTFAPIGELRLDASYQITKAFSIKCGYTGIVAGGVSRASRRVGYIFPEAAINDINKHDTFISNGFNFGFEVNR
ncbi:MAG: BBP7 family outer membrane beta-barrel protein [Pirellulales bacterium]